MKTITSNKSTDTGAALIVGLWILAVLALTSLGLAYRTRMTVRVTALSKGRLQALYLCKAMTARAIMELERDENDFDSRDESWCRHRAFTDEGWLAEMGLENQEETVAKYAVWDESGKINVNVSGEQFLWNLKALETAQASAILDWIDSDDMTRPGGAESDYYERLDPPGQAKNAKIFALDELLCVKDITPELFLGAGEAGDDTIEKPYQNGLRPLLTVFGEDGLININTAQEEVLCAISSSISEETADAIAQRVRGPDGVLGTEDDRPFEDLDELETVYGITEFEIAILKNNCKVTSDVFSILCHASLRNGKVKRTLRAIALRDRDTGRVRIIAWREN